MNNLKHIFFASMLMASMTAAAQETYQDAKLAAPQLTGTARYVGMGGAMEALGADISTISSNPAGVGLFHLRSCRHCYQSLNCRGYPRKSCYCCSYRYSDADQSCG